jgi:uncharacterized protein with PIN domain
MSDYKRQNPVRFSESVACVTKAQANPSMARCPDCEARLRVVLEPHQIFDPYCPSCEKACPRPLLRGLE